MLFSTKCLGGDQIQRFYIILNKNVPIVYGHSQYYNAESCHSNLGYTAAVTFFNLSSDKELYLVTSTDILIGLLTHLCEAIEAHGFFPS